MSLKIWQRILDSTRASGRRERNRRRPTACTAATRCQPRLETLEDRCLLSFGAGGVVTTDLLATQGDWIEGVALQADGKIVAAGNNGLARYNADGTLDVGFNAGGSQPGTIVAGGYQHYFNDVALQADGKIVAAGMKLGTYDLDFLVSRYTPAGIPDATFGVNGQVTLVFQGGTSGTNDEIEALAIQPDGKIVVAGRAHNSSKSEWVVMRFLPNGSLDTSFDRDGKLTTTFGNKTSTPAPYAVVLQPDGKILVAGNVYGGTTSRTDFAVVRYNADGSLDQTFGQGGKVRTDFGSEVGQAMGVDEARSIALQSDGKIVVGGNTTGGITYTERQSALVRYNPNGSLDSTFDGNGKVSRSGPRYESVSIQPDGKIVAGGGDGTGLVDRFSAAGSPDTSFDLDGRRTLNDASSFIYLSTARDVAIQPDGKILVVGGSDSYGDTRFALARLNTDGSLDAAAPLMAASQPAPADASLATLTYEQLQPVLADASARWSAAGADVSELTGVTVQILGTHDDVLSVDELFGQLSDQRSGAWLGGLLNDEFEST